MTAKKSHLRGVNDIPAMMTVPLRDATAAQSANALARLEHQKTLLEKQLQVWNKQKTITEYRLQMVQSQIAATAESLRKAQEPRVAKAPVRKPRSVAATMVRPKRHADVIYSY
jgi:preprotein translocase subunit SecD